MNIKDFAPTAPMGWNSYDYYDTTVTEEEVKANADYMAEHLKEFGYEYVVIDIEWYSNDAGTRRDEHQYLPFGDDEIDAYGRFQPSPSRFPSSADGSGFTHLADYIHELGLKFGIHIMRGIPRAAAHAHMPIFGLDGITAADVADPSSICGWNPDMYGVRNIPEGQTYYDGLIKMYADWGVDFIKCDDICDTWMYGPDNHIEFSGWAETRMIHRAILKCGRPITLSLSPGPAHVDRAWEYAQNANMWRITDDFWDNWELLKPMFWRCETWQNQVQRGSYPDCDMLPVGYVGKGFGEERKTNFTRDEQMTMMTLWCMFGAPLMIGSELTKLDAWTLKLLTNKELLSLLDGHHHGQQIARNDSYAVWKSVDDRAGGDEYLALFNLMDTPIYIPADLAAVGLRQAPRALPDIWTKERVPLRSVPGLNENARRVPGGAIAAMVPAHGVRLFRVE